MSPNYDIQATILNHVQILFFLSFGLQVETSEIIYNWYRTCKLFINIHLEAHDVAHILLTLIIFPISCSYNIHVLPLYKKSL